MPTTPNDPINSSQLEIKPLSMKNWGDFERLFGKNGACGHCWCMYYRLSNFKKQAYG